MTPAVIYDQLITTLEGNPALSAYIKRVFKGQRYDIVPEALPCLMVEPVQNNDIEKDYGQVKNVYLSLDIIAVAYNPNDFEKTIVGDNDYKGILDIENDVRACLQSSNTLGDNVIDTIFADPSIYDRTEVGKYPVRGVLIPVKILYRQTDGV